MKKFIQLLTFLGIAFFSVAQAVQINFSPIPDVGAGDAEAKFKAIIKHLEQETGYKIKFRPVSSYSAITIGMRKKQIDLSYLGPKGYLEARKRANAVPLVVELNEAGQPGYHSIIITRTDSPFKSIKDLRNKKFAFVDPGSTSGGVVPSVYFAKINLVPKEYFSRVLYTGSHEASILSLRNGKIDGIVTNDLDFNEGVTAQRWKAENYRTLWKSDVIPGTLFAAGGHVDQNIVAKLRQALLSFDDKKTFKEMGISGFQATTDSDYDPVREVVKLKKEMAKKKK